VPALMRNITLFFEFFLAGRLNQRQMRLKNVSKDIFRDFLCIVKNHGLKSVVLPIRANSLKQHHLPREHNIHPAQTKSNESWMIQMPAPAKIDFISGAD